TKQDLMLRALTPRGMPAWIEALDRGPDARPVREQLLTIARAIDAFFVQMAPCISVLSASGITAEKIFAQFDEPPPARAHRGLTEWFGRLHAARRASVASPHAAASLFLGAFQGRHFMRHALGDKAPPCGDDFVERLVDILWSG